MAIASSATRSHGVASPLSNGRWEIRCQAPARAGQRLRDATELSRADGLVPGEEGRVIEYVLDPCAHLHSVSFADARQLAAGKIEREGARAGEEAALERADFAWLRRKLSSVLSVRPFVM